MATTYYDRLNQFFHANEQNPLAPSIQLVMLHLLQINNEHGNAGKFQVTDNYLAETTRLSAAAITEAKRKLKNLGFIDFKTDKGNPRKTTQYILPEIIKPKVPENISTAIEKLSVNSPKVVEAWRNCAGENLTGGAALGLIDLENIHGAEKVVKAIYAADQANTRFKLSFNFVKSVLENMTKGGKIDERHGNRGDGGGRNKRYTEYFVGEKDGRD